ncbi:MAG: PRC-barrel domain-containing protein [Saprospiraceae bacterium]
MRHALFSATSVIGTDVVDGNGNKLATLRDIILNKERGSIHNFILVSLSDRTAEERFYVVPHQFFHLNGDDEELIFNNVKDTRGVGNPPLLPDHYDEVEVNSLADFLRDVVMKKQLPRHRSDNQDTGEK